jgi:hypothetical protein
MAFYYYYYLFFQSFRYKDGLLRFRRKVVGACQFSFSVSIKFDVRAHGFFATDGGENVNGCICLTVSHAIMLLESTTR